jgi:hypothetical protein
MMPSSPNGMTALNTEPIQGGQVAGARPSASILTKGRFGPKKKKPEAPAPANVTPAGAHVLTSRFGGKKP